MRCTRIRWGEGQRARPSPRVPCWLGQTTCQAASRQLCDSGLVCCCAGGVLLAQADRGSGAMPRRIRTSPRCAAAAAAMRLPATQRVPRASLPAASLWRSRFGAFNEPYYEDYIATPLGPLFEAAGLKCGMKVGSSAGRCALLDWPGHLPAVCPSATRPPAPSCCQRRRSGQCLCTIACG